MLRAHPMQKLDWPVYNQDILCARPWFKWQCCTLTPALKVNLPCQPYWLPALLFHAYARYKRYLYVSRIIPSGSLTFHTMYPVSPFHTDTHASPRLCWWILLTCVAVPGIFVVDDLIISWSCPTTRARKVKSPCQLFNNLPLITSVAVPGRVAIEMGSTCKQWVQSESRMFKPIQR